MAVLFIGLMAATPMSLAQVPPKVAFIYASSAQDGGWNEALEAGRKAVEEQLQVSVAVTVQVLPVLPPVPSDEVMSVVESNTVFQVGTFNGNPLTMAAARAGLLEVLTPEAYEHIDKINDRLVAGCQDVVDRYRLPAYTVGISSKGCVMFSDTKIVDYETFMTKQNAELTELAWLYNLNRGVFATPGREEEWTLSVSHTEEAADAYIAVFEELASDLTA